MIKEKQQLLRRLLMLIDVFVIGVSFFAAFLLRHNLHLFYKLDLFPGRQLIGELDSGVKHLAILPIVLLSWWASLASNGLYGSLRKESVFELVWGIIKSSLLVVVVMSIIVFIFKVDFISRFFILSLFVIACVLLSLERISIVSFLRFIRKKGYNYRNILVVGTGTRAENFIKMVHKHNEWGLRIIGLIDVDKKKLNKVVCGERVIGLLNDMPDILHQNSIDEVIYIVPRSWLNLIEKSLLACEIEGVKTNIAADFFNMKIARSVSSEIEGIPLLGFRTTVPDEWQLLLKRLFDIIISLTGIIICLPLFLALVVLIKFLSPGPAVFRQVRSGLNGRRFIMYKFRTMFDGAEKKREELSAFNEMKGPVFKMKNDPRVTRFGAFLRRTSLDELPQLFNVLKGEMSIVGPRPPIPKEVEKYQVWQRRRLSMKPGLTCLWQANGRNNVDFEKWMNMDLEYIDTWSLGLDFKILLKTIPSVLLSVGAR